MAGIPGDPMDYFPLHELLRNRVSFDEESIALPWGMQVRNFSFTSQHADLLPADGESHSGSPDGLDVADACVRENRAFPYHVFHPENGGRSRKMILLLHGFNEKHWHKYLPWAAKLLEKTGSTVVLFPMAFHMNRAPHEWSDSRLMHRVSRQRKAEHPDVLQSSLVNAAISTRLHRNPQRFIWSGLQTFEDVRDFVKMCKAGGHPLFEPGCSVDIMAYSIGAFLSEVLLLSNPDGLFSDTRLFMFCGGAVFNRMSPVSKFILDSQANVRLYSFLVEHLESHLRHDPKLRLHLGDQNGVAFRSMLNYREMADFREERFAAMADRLAALALTKDAVIPPYEVENTLKGRSRRIPVAVETMDFPYPYDHETPFPALAAMAEAVNESFSQVFETAARFLK